MRAILTVLILALAVLAKDHPDERLRSVRTLFVAGNNQAAEKARQILRDGKTCFALSTKGDAADATLEIAAESQTMGGGFGSLGARTWIASGNLTLRSGDLIWSHSQRFSDDPLRSGGKIAGELLLKRLASEGCKR